MCSMVASISSLLHIETNTLPYTPPVNRRNKEAVCLQSTVWHPDFGETGMFGGLIEACDRDCDDGRDNRGVSGEPHGGRPAHTRSRDGGGHLRFTTCCMGLIVAW